MPKDPTHGIRVIITILLIVGLNTYFFHWEGIKTAFLSYMEYKGYKTCTTLYEIKHKSVENARYEGNFKISNPIMWSDKLQSCVLYYNLSDRRIGRANIYEVWDYSKDELVLKYRNEPSQECGSTDTSKYKLTFDYKYDNSLDVYGCDPVSEELSIRASENFIKAMKQIGIFKN